MSLCTRLNAKLPEKNFQDNSMYESQKIQQFPFILFGNKL